MKLGSDPIRLLLNTYTVEKTSSYLQDSRIPDLSINQV